MSAGVVFVDRDGTLNELVPDPITGNPESPLRVEDVELMPGVPAALRYLMRAGWRLVGVSNQPAAAKGIVTLPALDKVQERVTELTAAARIRFQDFRICHHHPEGVVAELTQDCDCRKPKPGLLLQAAADHDIDLRASWMIGDTDADVLAGRTAGCRTILLENPLSVHRRSGKLTPTAHADDLSDAASLILLF